MKTNLEIVREACVKANPDICLKQTGCLINWGGGIKYQSMILFQNESGNYVVWDKENGRKTVLRNQINLVLGRPIRLADVLQAIMNSKVTWMDMWMVAPTGSFWKQDWINGGDEGSKERAKFASEFGNMEWNLTQETTSAYNPMKFSPSSQRY